ncbi:hypothetical protein [Streptomyces sp. H51]|uniref:hypothetical protein n=1 Tax=Streptomyces sp. H51 TaxID=3111770 RepID=UPI003B63F9CB
MFLHRVSSWCARSPGLRPFGAYEVVEPGGDLPSPLLVGVPVDQRRLLGGPAGAHHRVGEVVLPDVINIAMEDQSPKLAMYTGLLVLTSLCTTGQDVCCSLIPRRRTSVSRDHVCEPTGAYA